MGSNMLNANIKADVPRVEFDGTNQYFINDVTGYWGWQSTLDRRYWFVCTPAHDFPDYAVQDDFGNLLQVECPYHV